MVPVVPLVGIVHGALVHVSFHGAKSARIAVGDCHSVAAFNARQEHRLVWTLLDLTDSSIMVPNFPRFVP